MRPWFRTNKNRMMKTINFEKFELKSLSGRIDVLDVKEAFAELIYAHLGGLKYKLLAEKIYKSNGDCELDDLECELLATIAAPESGYLSNKFADAIRKKINDVE